MSKITVSIDLAKYKYVDLSLEESRDFLRYLEEKVGKMRDVDEAIRYIDNFDEFYNYMKKKFKEFIAIPHTPDDYIKSRVFIDKIRLYVKDSEKRVVFVLDRRVSKELIKEILNKLGYRDVVFEKLF